MQHQAAENGRDEGIVRIDAPLSGDTAAPEANPWLLPGFPSALPSVRLIQASVMDQQ